MPKRRTPNQPLRNRTKPAAAGPCPTMCSTPHYQPTSVASIVAVVRHLAVEEPVQGLSLPSAYLIANSSRSPACSSLFFPFFPPLGPPPDDSFDFEAASTTSGWLTTGSRDSPPLPLAPAREKARTNSPTHHLGGVVPPAPARQCRAALVEARRIHHSRRGPILPRLPIVIAVASSISGHGASGKRNPQNTTVLQSGSMASTSITESRT